MRRVISDYFVLARREEREREKESRPKLDCARRLDIVHCPLNIYLKGTQMRASNGFRELQTLAHVCLQII
ncbi:hypothetical protein ALC56_11994 [Trachymyrmex septentrionalis]|uniref:Uncharacterized protein n=1 Tax=Trachymyrmex septentrionalis TaxID=34720 RepID=A0A195F054_9HYME|nr:hypothetical protein ALC56_11994 [Trachymyrmex septentrionalis]